MAKDIVTDTLVGTILDLVKRIENLLVQQQTSDPQSRILVALAGVPGSGKSTVSQALLVELASRGICDAAVVPMDGFHYTKNALAEFENPTLTFQRRGAPFTFDATAFVDLVKSIKCMPLTATSQPEQFLYAPSFDHAIQDPVENAIPISSRNRLIIVEGNYTLLEEEPWRGVAALCDEKWFVDVSKEVVLERLVRRHLVAGIETSALKAAERVRENDLVNADLIREKLITPDVVIEN
ncbi:nicotinamide riboside kinase [Lentithecium fluviatile CBS 122367]|uniref:Nicotinamide riboside kinase n=1 Tax=Lentithecium fluviatile CBS 122367 TaxID=1168545 RepID=A0A6G1IG43_9PLEO|nr:nicotinamide riboside kinase [Lentithecium fluviatile CBS 122367]